MNPKMKVTNLWKVQGTNKFMRRMYYKAKAAKSSITLML